MASRRSSPTGEWERIMADLNAHRRAERATWGDIDDVRVARYLAGTCTPEERQEVEQALRSYPAVQHLIGTVQALMAEEPAWASISTGTSAVWESVQNCRRLKDRLVAWLDEAGSVLTAGLAHCLYDHLQPAVGLTLGSAAAAGQDQAPVEWRLPLEEDSWLTLRVRRSAVLGEWQVDLKLAGAQRPGWPGGARLEVWRGAARLEHAGPLRGEEQESLLLPDGDWQLRVCVAQDVREVPLALGRQPT